MGLRICAGMRGDGRRVVIGDKVTYELNSDERLLMRSKVGASARVAWRTYVYNCILCD